MKNRNRKLSRQEIDELISEEQGTKRAEGKLLFSRPTTGLPTRKLTAAETLRIRQAAIAKLRGGKLTDDKPEFVF
jgi:hypothetical protein